MARRDLRNKRVLLTGASAGIGWELAQQLAQKGTRLLLTARRQHKLEELREKIHKTHPKIEVEILAGDITDVQLREQLADYCRQAWKGLDLLINNAGVGSLGTFEDSNPETLREVMEVNFFAPVELIRVCLPLLKLGTQPLIANISSVLGHRAVPFKTEYCASKFAIHGFSDALRAELAEQSIDLTLISPSTTDSEFFENAVADNTDRNWKGKKAMPPEKVASATVKAVEKGTHEVILTLGGKTLVLMDRLAPTLTDLAVQRWG